MSAPAPALLAAAAGVAFGHAILPDHWLPLALLGRTRGYPLARVARLSSLAGLTHVLVSLVLGAVIVVVGLQFRTAIQGDEDTIVGSILVLTGIAFVAMESERPPPRPRPWGSPGASSRRPRPGSRRAPFGA